ncbi:hypothetical protein [Cognatiluteimonas profundi]|uniref:hypothetical protein n=1 Tax=Cognatiluteimonas profundi TaxID=2594501 RepID=UPI00131BB4E3|nr:hypothetical protein [Lysobacter profundi]
MNAVGVFTEERLVGELGEPGPLLSRRLETFTGPAGSSIKAMVTYGDGWHVDVQERIGPLEWSG